MSSMAIKIRLSTTDPAEVARIAAALERQGLRVRQRMPQLGLVTGDADTSRLDALRGVAGVAAIEPEGGVQLPPFDRSKPQ